MKKLNEQVSLTKSVKNKTYQYLVPFLKTYKYNFNSKLSALNWLAFGIGDYFFDKELKSRLFALINVKDGASFQAFLDWFRENKYHIDDYPFSDIEFKDTNLHMIVIDYTDEKSFNAFINSKFSQMYEGQNLSKFIRRIIPYLPEGGGKVGAITNPIYQVISRDEDAKQTFINKIKEEFGTELTLVDLADGRELETPINKQEEIFNS